MSEFSEEEKQLIHDFLAVYKRSLKMGKFFGMVVVAVLGFVVLLSQAWDAVKNLFVKLGAH